MSPRHPIITVSGASGEGTAALRETFAHIFERERVAAAHIDGAGFRRFDRQEMEAARRAAAANGDVNFSQFGRQANLLGELEAELRAYAESGACRTRDFADTPAAASQLGVPEGRFTPWQEVPAGTDVLLYQGLHGAYRDATVDISGLADLRIGVVPVVNLEWIEKLHRDSARGLAASDVTETILRRMQDYVTCITPQFSETDINFQRIPIVDTSNPFIARWVPTPDETMVVIRFRNPRGIDFGYLLSMIHDSFMSRANSIVVPGGKLDIAIQLIMTPLILQLVERRRRILEL